MAINAVKAGRITTEMPPPLPHAVVMTMYNSAERTAVRGQQAIRAVSGIIRVARDMFNSDNPRAAAGWQNLR
jgi:hypothetical protein